MRHGSLESGLGGFDYAAQQMGWANVFHCEINKFCQSILNHYWPHAKSYTDLFEFDAREWRGKVDIITAGFPCQPFSHAGKRKGSKDERHIWPENLRIFREAKPKWIVCENVPGLITIEHGMVFEQVCLDLENEGYEVQPFIIPACAKDAAHRRDRVWIVAYTGLLRPPEHEQQAAGVEQQNSNAANLNGIGHIHGQPEINTAEGREYAQREFEQCVTDAADNNNKRLERSKEARNIESGRQERNEQPGRCYEKREHWFEAATRLCGLDDELAGRLDAATISKSKWRVESLKAYGNAIYWPVAYEIFKAIEQYEL